MPAKVVDGAAGRRLGSNSQFINAVRKSGIEELVRRVNNVAADAVARTDAIVKKDYVTDRPDARRRGGPRLLGSFAVAVTIDRNARFPVTFTLTSSADPAKVNSLNQGSNEHDIVANNKPFLKFPTTEARYGRRGPGKRSPFAEANAYGTGAWTKTGSVNHPGTGRGAFMERGLDGAVEAALRTAVARKRS